MNRIINWSGKFIFNTISKKVNKKYVVFESDDWGAVRMPSYTESKRLMKSNLKLEDDYYAKFDSLETADDLISLFNVISRYRDSKGNHPIITTNTIVANPDFERIKDAKFCKYFWEPFTTSLYRSNNGSSCFDLLIDGINNKFLFPQFHGREHLNALLWLDELRNGSKELLDAFNYRCYCVPYKSQFNRRKNVMAALDRYGFVEELEFHKRYISEGLDLFKSIFNFPSRSFIAPTYIWHNHIEKYLFEKNVQIIQGLPIQYDPSSSNKYKRRYHYIGQRNSLGMIYLIRNVFFEPASNLSLDWVDLCLSKIHDAFLNKLPVVIGTHRVNFTGTLSEKNRSNNLIMFDMLLSTILKKWPDVEFVTSEQLGLKFINSTKNEL